MYSTDTSSIPSLKQKENLFVIRIPVVYCDNRKETATFWGSFFVANLVFADVTEMLMHNFLKVSEL